MQARGRGARTVPAARRRRSPRAAAARRSVWRLSHGPGPRRAGRGAAPAGICGLFFLPPSIPAVCSLPRRSSGSRTYRRAAPAFVPGGRLGAPQPR